MDDLPTLPGTAPDEPEPLRCRMCGHPLRDRVSRRWGLGPECRRRLRMRLAPVPGPFEPAQDPLPGLARDRASPPAR
ncbi:DUF6011 domain-containing protein [Streptomyces xiaopingdaonensis]|uniref:DUF6011 domain-containing protein n=1 Tax=Streptomyces xiaopingdaonensis TaxID=1565415 RepID=UPI0003671D8A|nr:DUF6011 domain-containing protein [Streptomyces xiaopingdaonensis]